MSSLLYEDYLLTFLGAICLFLILFNLNEIFILLSTFVALFYDKTTLDMGVKINILALSFITLLGLISFRLLKFFGLSLNLRLGIIIFLVLVLWVLRNRSTFLPALLETKLFQGFFYYFLLIEERYLAIHFL